MPHTPTTDPKAPHTGSARPPHAPERKPDVPRARKVRSSASGMGNRALKLMVILLSSINASMWLLYTESPVMAGIWAAIGVGFFFWILDDMRRGV
jgi:hypothetical protein